MILPCPFCGASASVEEYPAILGGDTVVFSVGCDAFTEEACMGYQSLTVFNTRIDAIIAWNKRAPRLENE